MGDRYDVYCAGVTILCTALTEAFSGTNRVAAFRAALDLEESGGSLAAMLALDPPPAIVKQMRSDPGFVLLEADNGSALALVEALLMPVRDKRPSALEALRHPFFRVFEVKKRASQSGHRYLELL